jgi:MoaA/NifB/PqqE/SkfB family radical SAM enzyme
MKKRWIWSGRGSSKNQGKVSGETGASGREAYKLILYFESLMGEGGRIDIENGELEVRGSQGDTAETTDASYRAKVDANGRLPIPPSLINRFGLEPGAEVEIVPGTAGLVVRPNIHGLARVYIEPTARCNLACGMCVRNSWKEPIGDMDRALFDRLVSQLGQFPHLDSVMFGGFGEPTAHPDILHMIKATKELAVRVELITNGTNLDETMIAGFMDAGLDRLWVSLDGVTEGSFDDIRQGARFDSVMANLRRLREMNWRRPRRIDVGIAFVVMKQNIDDLRKIDTLIKAAGARFVSVSNLLPYTKAMEQEMVCSLALTLETFAGASGRTEISLPRLDIDDRTKEAIFSLLRTCDNLSLMGNPISAPGQSCRFIKDRCTFVRWDGKVSPCMGLLHTHKTYLNGLERTVSAYTLGDVGSDNLHGIWNSDEYARFREKVRGFLFSPCHLCGGCSFLEKNEEDCCGNTFPTCGGCLWAQGVIQCP